MLSRSHWQSNAKISIKILTKKAATLKTNRVLSLYASIPMFKATYRCEIKQIAKRLYRNIEYDGSYK